MTSYGNYDNRHVHLRQLAGAFHKYDKDRNGLSRNEINFAMDDARRQGKQNEYEFWSTLLFGGKAGNGSMPDINGDQRVQWSELKDLAAQTKGRRVIDASDFLRGFGSAAKHGGNLLPPMSSGYPSGPQPYGPPPTTYGSQPGYNQGAPYPGFGQSGGGFSPMAPQQGLAQVMQTMLQLFQQLIPMLQSSSSLNTYTSPRAMF